MKKLMIGTGVTVAGLLFGGAAFASWGGSGSGTGTAATASAKSIVLAISSPSTTALYPGQSGSVSASITDPYSSQAVTITGLTGTVTTSNEATCPGVANFSISSHPAGLPSAVQPGSPFSGTLSNAVTMSSGAASGCQGVTVTVQYSVTGKLG